MSDLSQISEDTTNKNEHEHDHINKLEINESIKTTEDESSDENDSEYEDVEEDEFDDTSVLTSITNKKPFKVKTIISHLISFYLSVILGNY